MGKIYTIGFGCYPYSECKKAYGAALTANSLFKATARYDSSRNHP